VKRLIIFLTVLVVGMTVLVGCSDSKFNRGTDTTLGVSQTSNIDLNSVVTEITSKVQWASLMQIDDKDVISEFFTLDVDNINYKQIVVYQCPMSAVVAEIILIQANDVSLAKKDLEARREKLINADTYYPNAKEVAENSIVGVVGDIVYFIAGENAVDSEEVLLNYFNS
jgi:hypothetical protein